MAREVGGKPRAQVSVVQESSEKQTEDYRIKCW